MHDYAKAKETLDYADEVLRDPSGQALNYDPATQYAHALATVGLGRAVLALIDTIEERR
jgi:hypothetical protein